VAVVGVSGSGFFFLAGGSVQTESVRSRKELYRRGLRGAGPLGCCEYDACAAWCGHRRRGCTGGLGDRHSHPADDHDAHAAGDDAVGLAATAIVAAAATTTTCACDATAPAAARDSSALLCAVTAAAGGCLCSGSVPQEIYFDRIAVGARGLEPACGSGPAAQTHRRPTSCTRRQRLGRRGALHQQRAAPESHGLASRTGARLPGP
jgi:hypothetical protein